MKGQISARAAQVIEDELKADRFGSDAYELALWALYHSLSSGQKEVLRQLLFHGPVYDGDIASKSARDDLFDYDLAVRCAFKGEQGFTAGTYRAVSVWKAGQENSLGRPTIAEVEQILKAN